MKNPDRLPGLLTVKKGDTSLCENTPAVLVIEHESINTYTFQWHFDNISTNLTGKDINDITGGYIDIEVGYSMIFVENATTKQYRSEVFITEIAYPDDRTKGVSLSFQGGESLGGISSI